MRIFSIAGHNATLMKKIIFSMSGNETIQLVDIENTYTLTDSCKKLQLCNDGNVIMTFDAMTNKVEIECSDFNGVKIAGLILQVMF